MNHDRPYLPYRPCVGAFMLNKSNQLFVAARIDNLSENWQLPQGGIDEGECNENALYRELQEEIGTNKVEILEKLDRTLDYDLPANLIPKLWNGQYRGQRQTWYALRFMGEDGDINIQTPHPEFRQWRWIAPTALLDFCVEFKKDVYNILLSEFKKYYG